MTTTVYQTIPGFYFFIYNFFSPRAPIEQGLPSDASDGMKLVSMERQLELRKKVEAYVHRKGRDVLQNLIPPIHDNLLELHQSQIQIRLTKHLEKNKKSKSFLR